MCLAGPLPAFDLALQIEIETALPCRGESAWIELPRLRLHRPGELRLQIDHVRSTRVVRVLHDIELLNRHALRRALHLQLEIRQCACRARPYCAVGTIHIGAALEIDISAREQLLSSKRRGHDDIAP